jgi:hypothetical protein
VICREPEGALTLLLLKQLALLLLRRQLPRHLLRLPRHPQQGQG